METSTKKPWQSKTVIINAILGLAAVAAMFFPQASVVTTYINSNAAMIGTAWSVLNIILRAISKDKISLGD